jgi:2,3-bisphosphoglycerate-dependent phosphoglycerate mutase
VSITTLYLVRHAHAVWTQDDDRPLSEEGRTQAAVLARLLGGLPIRAVYSSPSRRAVETIEPLASHLQLHRLVVADLRERALVVPPGVAFESAVRSAWLNPDAAARETESNEAAQARGLAVIRTLVARHQGQEVVVTTHGNLLALILNGLNPTFGFEFWRRLSFPDVYELRVEGAHPVSVRRVWQDSGNV